ncbi:MAG: winged helix-turn-helix transcriptional regulator [Spirochaetes bacterium]|nr:winged helix-turn-helix transcriptional regulator [Spirochaetota bacterium]
MHEFSTSYPRMRTWLLIHQVSRLLNVAEYSIFAKLGLRKKKHSVLLALKNLKNPVTVTDVARWLDRNSNGISMLINRMEKEGLIDKIRDMPDQRIVRLTITEKGEDYFEKGKLLNRELVKTIFNDIDEEDLEKLSILLQKLRKKTLDYLNKDPKFVIIDPLESDELS